MKLVKELDSVIIATYKVTFNMAFETARCGTSLVYMSAIGAWKAPKISLRFLDLLNAGMIL